MAKKAWREFARFCMDVTRRFFEDRSTQTAGSLTYTTLLSLVPLFTVALSVSTAFPAFDRLVEALQDYVLEHFLPETDGVDVIAEQLNAFTARAGQLTAIGIAVLAVTAVMLMLTIDDALNRIFRVARPRHLAQRVLIYWAVLTLGPVLIGASLSLTSFLVVNSLGLLDLNWLTQTVLRLLPFVLTAAALTLLYVLVPNCRVAPLHAAAGGFFAGIAFEIAKRAFALYVSKFPTYTIIYGAFSTALIFLVWLYLSWLIVLAGATLAAMLPGYGAHQSSIKEKL